MKPHITLRKTHLAKSIENGCHKPGLPFTKLLSTASLSLALGLSASNSHAAPGGGGARALEEVVVTATRREEGLQSIPASISAVSAADMEERGITDFQQVTEAVSGLSLSKPGSAISSGVYLRGVGTAGTSPASQSVGVLVDGVYQLRVGVAFSELMDLDRVEILRGPQGTWFGRNTTAGVIRIFTADPDTHELSGKIQAVAGNLDTRELRGILNVPVIEDKLALRFSAYTAERDGYTENVFLNEDTRNVDREGWRAKLLWNVTDSFQVKLMYEDTEQDTDLDSSLVEYPDSLLAAYPILADTPISLGKAQQQHGQTTDEVERMSLHLKWDFWNHTLSTISAWDDLTLFLLDDRDRTILTSEQDSSRPFFFALTNLGETESETHEIQLSSNWDGPFNYVVGYYFQNEQLTSTTNLISSAGTLFRPPTERDVDSKAYFATIFYDFNEQWRMSLGGRKTDDTKEGANGQFTDGELTFKEDTYSAKLMYQMDENKMFYFAHDKGFKSGGINREFSFGRTLTEEEATWDPEISYNYELGMKSEWLDNRLRINGALFYQTYEDFQVTQNIQALSNVLVLNATEVESMGIEADFVAILNENLSLNGSVAYVMSEYEDFEDATCTDGSAGCVGGLQDLSGETLDHAPELTFNLGGEYRERFAAIDATDWFVRLDVIFKDDQNLYFEQPEEAEQDAYYLVNGRIGLDSGDGWKLTLWGNNLFDEEYLVEATVDSGGVFQTPGLERTYGLTVDWSF